MGQNQSSEKGSRASTPHDKDRRARQQKSLTTTTTDGGSSHVSQTTQGKTPLSTTTSPLSATISPDTPSRARSQKKKGVDISEVSSKNIDIPSSTMSSTRSREEELGAVTYGSSYAPVSRHRPPRLPLPIAEVPIPDSPSLGPVKPLDDVPFFHDEMLQRRNSMLSETTQDEEDVGEELLPFGVGPTDQTVPYDIVWNEPAEKVFVTGTFAGWDRKYRLKKSERNPNLFKTTINLPPGTHHLKFFVDNQMRTSKGLPTAVDFNNILVNYIEIGLDDIPKSRRESSLKQPALSVSPQNEDQNDPISGTATPGERGEGDSSDYSEIEKEELPEGDFRRLVPQALVDMDSVPEDDPRYKWAAQVLTDVPPPPSLPMFLSRSILNGNLPVKDDSSVLALPNHTVLNHLMTSSVRNGVLATSVTCRYKKKYVTTISFKPVPKKAEVVGT